MKRVFKKVYENPFLKEFFIHGFKFSLVGILNTLVGFLSFHLFFYLFGWDYRFSNVLSYILGVINSFFFNKFWTFKSKKNV